MCGGASSTSPEDRGVCGVCRLSSEKTRAGVKNALGVSEGGWVECLVLVVVCSVCY